MGFFGSDSRSTVLTTSSTSNEQTGVEGYDNIVVDGNLTQNFPDEVAKLVTQSIDLVGSAVGGFERTTAGANEALKTVAERQKSPESAYLPFLVVAAGVVVAISIWGK